MEGAGSREGVALLAPSTHASGVESTSPRHSFGRNFGTVCFHISGSVPERASSVHGDEYLLWRSQCRF